MSETNILLEELERYYKLWRESIILYEEWSRANGLSYNSVMVLTSIYENKDNCTQKMISEKWQLPKQTVNTILKEIQKQDFIQLSTLATDKRTKTIHLTKTGEQYAEKVVTSLRELELSVLRKMGVEELIRFNDGYELFVKLFRQEKEMRIEQS